MGKRTFAKPSGIIKMEYGNAPARSEMKAAKNKIYFKGMRYDSVACELSGSINFIRVKVGKSYEDVEQILNSFLDSIEPKTPTRGRKKKEPKEE